VEDTEEAINTFIALVNTFRKWSEICSKWIAMEPEIFPCCTCFCFSNVLM